MFLKVINLEESPIATLPTVINKDLCLIPAGELKFKPRTTSTI